jgi:Kef-type K+ transport system membrane component KefB/K+/H+ antiporter YhaU regulatory subunit KhtT
MHLPLLIGDLALILMVAGIFSILFRRLKQPTVLGYLLAGLVVGPHVSVFPTIVDFNNIKVWAELGIIIFLFLLGMEFSFKKLIRVGKPAFVAAAVKVVATLSLGYFVGRWFEWNTMDSIFLGALLSISSTAIVVKAFEELSVKSQTFASLVYGILIIEDLFAIVILAFLSTLAVSRSFEGSVFFIQMAKLCGFLIVVIPLGLYLMPWFLKKVRPYMNDETRVVLALGLCLSLVLLASRMGLSAALGAFLMGAFMAETVEGERTERFLTPIKDLFGAIFFTSVGMLVNLSEIIGQFNLIFIVVLITVVGKILVTTLGMRIARQSKTVSIQTGLSLAQIGEFSFIIATLGLELGVVRSDLYSLTVAVSIVTTFITPYLIRYSVSPRFLGVKSQPNSTDKSIPKIWDGHLVEMEVHPHFINIGRTLEEMHLREVFGISVVAIIRGEIRLTAPTRYERLMAYDRIIVLGTDEQLQAFEKHLKSERHSLQDMDSIYYELKSVEIKQTSKLIGKSLRSSGIREEIDGIIFGIQRDNQRHLNPDSTFIIKANDLLWVYGERTKIRQFESQTSQGGDAEFHH